MYCQKCRTPLKADSSLNDLNPAAFDLLVGTVTRSDRKPAQRPHVTHPRDRKALYDKASSQNQSPLHKRIIASPRDDLQELSGLAAGHPGMSFVEITESQIVPPDTNQRPTTNGATSQPSTDPESAVTASAGLQYDRQQKMLAVLSAHSDIDHPVCTECTSLLLVTLNAKLAASTREQEAYATFLKQLQHSSANQKDQEPSAERELLALKKEEEAAFVELEALEQQKLALEAELAELEDENRELEKEEELFWTSRNTFAEQQHDLETDLASLQQKYSHDQKQLERLQRTNVYNDTFYISHDGYFGTINGLRLGRLPNQNVEWAEINAAWGQTLLLLQTIAERLSFTFQGYRLRPLGSTSRIEKLEYPQQGPSSISNPTTSNTAQATVSAAKITHLDMYSSGEIALGRVFNHRRFDQGMVAFLDCLKQLGTHVESSSAVGPNRETPRPPLTRNTTAATNVTAINSSNQPLRLPYAIDGDKIGSRDRPDDSVSIKLGVGFSQDENFTKACKYTLTCCKYLLAHVSNLESSKSV